MKVATLGPKGTCSEEVAVAYVISQGWAVDNSLVLCNTFEDAVEMLLGDSATQAIVPAAYMNYHNIVFQNMGRISVYDVLYSRTSSFVLAGKPGKDPEKVLDRRLAVACHHAPSHLLTRLTFDFDHVDAASNAVAAQLVNDNKADLCITQSRAIEEINRSTSLDETLHIYEYYGSVDMIWSVFQLGPSKKNTSFWRGYFNNFHDVDTC
jgi:hypothetical protein